MLTAQKWGTMSKKTVQVTRGKTAIDSNLQRIQGDVAYKDSENPAKNIFFSSAKKSLSISSNTKKAE
jgi:hypothetical protein